MIADPRFPTVEMRLASSCCGAMRRRGGEALAREIMSLQVLRITITRSCAFVDRNFETFPRFIIIWDDIIGISSSC
jgi:hypothetical protein